MDLHISLELLMDEADIYNKVTTAVNFTKFGINVFPFNFINAPLLPIWSQ